MNQPVWRGSEEVQKLQDRLARQELYIKTLLRLLLEKEVIHQEEFGEWLDYIDGMDGRLDGRLGEGTGSKTCGRCRRTNPQHARRCQYCDALFPSTEFLFPGNP